MAVILFILVVISIILTFAGIVAPFGPDVSEYPIRGVDVSHHQGRINWNEVANSGIVFTYIKASEGQDHRDSRFADNWRETGSVGVFRGAYHVFTQCRGGGEQADNFISIVPDEPNVLPTAVDVSSSGACHNQWDDRSLLAEFQKFADRIASHYGRPPIIYAARSSRLSKLLTTAGVEAEWIRGLIFAPALFHGKGWKFWQYSVFGKVAGIQGRVDLNTFNGDLERFRKLLLY